MTLVCAATASGNGGSRIEIATTYAADSRTVETNGIMTMSPEPGAAPREAHLSASTTLRRVGDCRPGQQPTGAAGRP